MDFDNEKLKARLAESELFTRKFGTFTKSDYELLMFTIYLDMLREEPSDHKISLDLGITESKARSLRVKSQLLYPREIKWEEAFSRALEKGFVDSDGQKVTIMIEDPSVQNIIKYQIEKSNGMVDRSFNIKHLVMPVASVVALAMQSEREKGTEEAVTKKLNTVLKAQNEYADQVTRQTLMEYLKGLRDPGELLAVISNIAGCFSSGMPIVSALKALLLRNG